MASLTENYAGSGLTSGRVSAPGRRRAAWSAVRERTVVGIVMAGFFLGGVAVTLHGLASILY